MKRTWATMNKTVGFKKSSGTLFPKQLVVDDLEIFDQKVITESFNYFLWRLDRNLNLKYHIH